MTQTPVFPPLMKGLAVGPANPFGIGCAQAKEGVDAGLITWSITDERLRAALVLAPDVPLGAAMAALIACALGLQNALGVLAPPETSLQLEWNGGVRLNGGHCGGFHIASSTKDADERPDWLVIGYELTRALPADWEPGETPDRTALDQEGCGDIDPVMLLEAWSRHSLNWLNGLEDTSGRQALYREWQGLAWKIGQQVTVIEKNNALHGVFLGVDENFGMLLKDPGGATRLIPLTDLIEEC